MKKQWDFLKNKFEANQLAHAYLFSGQDGSTSLTTGGIGLPAPVGLPERSSQSGANTGGQAGKKEFAKEFVKLINCQSYKSDGRQICKTDGGGQVCQSCKLIEKESFPDLLVIKSVNSKSSVNNEKDMMEIDVAQIREVSNFLSYKSYYGNYKAVIIENAERMNQEAQSCLLKTLEEPKGKTIIFLITKNPDLLLPTIFSRCQTIKFFPVEKYQESPEEKNTLQELLGIIHAELATKFQYTKKINLEGDNFQKMLRVLQRYFRNLLLVKIGALSPVRSQTPLASADARTHQTSNGVKGDQIDNYSIENLKKIIRLIESLHTQTITTNASPKLALEILLLELA